MTQRRFPREDQVRGSLEPRTGPVIPITGPDGTTAYTVVDEADAEAARKWRWRLSRTGYARRNDREDGRRTCVLLHRWVLGLKTGDPRQIDHISGDRLDNRRSNLRIVALGDNSQNVKPHRDGSSRFRGVRWEKRFRRWLAEARWKGKTYYIGLFASEDAAGAAAAEWRRAHMPLAVEGR